MMEFIHNRRQSFWYSPAQLIPSHLLSIRAQISQGHIKVIGDKVKYTLEINLLLIDFFIVPAPHLKHLYRIYSRYNPKLLHKNKPKCIESCKMSATVHRPSKWQINIDSQNHCTTLKKKTIQIIFSSLYIIINSILKIKDITNQPTNQTIHHNKLF